MSLFLVTFAVLLGVILWRLDFLFYQEQLSSSQMHTRTQVSALVKAVETEVQRAEAYLLLGYPQALSVGGEYGVDYPYSVFQMMSEIKQESGEWKSVKTFFRQDSDVKKWGMQYAQLALQNIKADKIAPGASHVVALLDPQGKPYFLVLMNRLLLNPLQPEEKRQAWFMAISGTELLQGVLDRQKGQSSEIFLTNQEGQTIAHTESQYIGKLLTEHPIVAQIKKSNVGGGSGIFTNLEGRKIQGFYESVPKTNLYVAIGHSLVPMLAKRDEVRLQMLLLGLGLALLGSAVFVLLYKPEKQLAAFPPVEPVRKAVSSGEILPTANKDNSVAAGVIHPKAIEPKEDRMKTFKTVASSLSHEMWSPLTMILGQTTALKSALTGHDSYEQLEKIEEQARRAREVVQKLLVFSGDGEPKFKTEKLEEVLTKALKRVDGKILSKGIKLSKDFNGFAQLVPDSLLRAFEAVLINAVESMDRVASKELKIKAELQADDIVIEIADSGEGIDSKKLERVFDPFYTSRSGQQHMGLGLSLALGLVRECQGEIDVESEAGKGTRVRIRIPQSMQFANEQQKMNTVPKALTANIEPRALAMNAEPKALVTNAVSAPTAPKLATPAVEISKTESSKSSLLVDDQIEKMLDGVDDAQVLGEKKLDPMEAVQLPPAPEDEFSMGELKSAFVPEKPAVKASDSQKLTAVDQTEFTAKIDKPKIQMKKKDSKLNKVDVSVRRPGAKFGETSS